MPVFATRPGSRFPPGATAYADGVALPEIPGRRWHVALDASRPPLDIVARKQQASHAPRSYRSSERSVAALEARV